MDNLKQLKNIKKAMKENDEDFFNIAEYLRNTALADPIRDKYQELAEQAKSLLIQPELPEGFSLGHPSSLNDAVAYAVYILPSTHAPVEAWGKVCSFDKVGDYGLEWCGEFLMPKGAPSLVRYACNRMFVIGKRGLQFNPDGHTGDN